MECIDKLSWLPIKDRKVLFLRTFGKDPLYTVGGKREEGETDEEALVREVTEEVGVVLKPETIVFANEFMGVAHGAPTGTMLRIRAYWADYEGELEPASEIAEMVWLSSKDKELATSGGVTIIEWLKAEGWID